MKRIPSAALAAAALLAALYLLPISRRGLLGPDEPRYASIARHMAESGDWVTPALWGKPWFEKPALLFWLGGLGHAIGLEGHTRLPVALLSLGFLAFFYRKVRDEFGEQVALVATCILSTSAGWIAYSDAGVFDAPLAVFTSAALLCLLPWVKDPESRAGQRSLSWFGGMLALGVLSKGLVAPVAAFFAVLPILCKRPGRVLDLLRPRALLPFALVCLPWYVACYARNGRIFLEEFLVRHHLERFVSSSLQHEQPWWFFGVVLVVFLLPWSPMLFGLRRDDLLADMRLRFLGCWALGPLLLFSLSVNKLPAYILPILPPLAILLAARWVRRPLRWLLAASAATLLLIPLAGALLPGALAHGITRAWANLDPTAATAGIVLGLLGAGAAAGAALKLRGQLALVAPAAIAALLLTQLKLETYPAASRSAGVREFYRENREQANEACLGELRRHASYGLRYYSRDRIPPCDTQPRRTRIEGDPPRIAPGPPQSPS